MSAILIDGGIGTRLNPLTYSISKQLLPVHSKPMIFYPMGTLLLAGARQILIVTTNRDSKHIQSYFGDGTELGIEIQYVTQSSPRGIADGLILGESFLDSSPAALILGDNIFHGAGVGEMLLQHQSQLGATVLTQKVSDPSRYGVLTRLSNGNVDEIIEKPVNFVGDDAITGLYFFDGTASSRAKSIQPSKRGELEITDVLKTYLADGLLGVQQLPRGTAWLDTGTIESLSQASEYIKAVENRQGYLVSSPEEIVWRLGLITDTGLLRVSEKYKGSDYGKYLRSLLR